MVVTRQTPPVHAVYNGVRNEYCNISPQALTVFSAYGEALGGTKAPDFAAFHRARKTKQVDIEGWEDPGASEINTLKVKSAGKALRFFAYDDFHKTFDRVVIARGGFEHNREQPV